MSLGYAKLWCIVAGLALFMAASENFCVVYSDVVYLKDGRSVEGEVTEKADGSVKLRVGEGMTISYSSKDVESILYERNSEELLGIYKQKAHRADPESADAHYQLGLFCERYNLFKEAEKEFRRSLEINPQINESIEGKLLGIKRLILLQTANKKFKEKCFTEAKDTYKKVLELYPNCSEAEEGIGKIEDLREKATEIKTKGDRCVRNNREKALEEYYRAVSIYPEISKEIQPEDAIFHFKLWQFFAETGFNDFMDKEFDTACTLNPKCEEIVDKYLSNSYDERARQEYNRAKQAYEGQDYELAIEKSENVLEKFNKSGYVTHAQALLKVAQEKQSQIKAKVVRRKSATDSPVDSQAKSSFGGATGKCSYCEGKGEVKDECYRCDGTGKCSYCKGQGFTRCSSCKGSGWIRYEEVGRKCTFCRGSGENLSGGKCPACKGKGYIYNVKRRKCSSCKGKGQFTCSSCEGSRLCQYCKGKGYTLNKCYYCRGTGKSYR